jgi:hypothetical protein
MIEVYIGGAVKKPGNYQVKKSLSIDEIIQDYVILENAADLSKININKKIQHKDRIIIPQKRN